MIYLKSNADHLTRSKLLHHSSVISKKQGDILSCLTTKRLKENKTIEEANLLVKGNRDCEKVLLSHLKLPMDTIITEEVFEPCTLVHFHSCTVPLLKAFYKVRMIINLSDKITIPKKGNVEDAIAGVIDTKTNGPILLSLAFKYRRMPVIGKVIPLPPIVTPTLLIKPPTIVKYESTC